MRLPPIACAIALLFIVSLLATAVHAEDGYQAWLRYRAAKAGEAPAASIVRAAGSVVRDAATAELQRGLSAFFAQDVPALDGPPRDGSIVLISDVDTAPAPLRRHLAAMDLPALGDAGFALRGVALDEGRCVVIAANTDRGVLYGAFALLRHLQLGGRLNEIDLRQQPAIPLRMINQWDNLDGTIERGYGGRSIYQWDELPKLNDRYTDYARLMASVGINAVAINNVNAGKGNNVQILSTEHLPKVAALAEAFRPYGIQLYLSVGFDAPRAVGKLQTADPLEPAVRQWWAEKASEIYRLIPAFGGFLIKADSEGQPGPYQYGRDHADGANMLAEALAPHGGTLIWRAFVYHMKPDEDRAAMAYQHFAPLDGRFNANALVQAKNGPLDFQVREPAHPLLGAMPQTRQVLELQITQEYTGHDLHVCHLVPSWKEVLDFDTHMKGEGSTVARRLGGSLLPHTGGIAGVLNIGQDPTWLGHHLHMASFYGFGRLAWDPNLSAEQIAAEWAGLTFSTDPVVVQTIASILLDSATAYESYTSPLGLGVLHDAALHLHPQPEIRHYYHQADNQSVGFDRTRATGSGYTAQYADPVAARFDSIDTCPIDLLLFFHSVPYDRVLPGGDKTLIQTLYDRYFDGVEQAKGLRRRWMQLDGRIDRERYDAVLAKLDDQVRHAERWRNHMTRFFFELSGIPDQRRRVRSQYRLQLAE